MTKRCTAWCAPLILLAAACAADVEPTPAPESTALLQHRYELAGQVLTTELRKADDRSLADMVLIHDDGEHARFTVVPLDLPAWNPDGSPAPFVENLAAFLSEVDVDLVEHALTQIAERPAPANDDAWLLHEAEREVLSFRAPDHPAAAGEDGVAGTSEALKISFWDKLRAWSDCRARCDYDATSVQNACLEKCDCLHLEGRSWEVCFLEMVVKL